VTSRVFSFPDSDQRIVFEPDALSVLSAHRQNEGAPEAGGLLFAEFDLPMIRVVKVSPPHIKDQRWRTLFIPDRRRQRSLIKKMFEQNLHFIGEWHTHPIEIPNPSMLDLESMSDSFRKSKHELDCFIMVIVRSCMTELDLWVSAHDGKGYFPLKEITRYSQERNEEI